MRIAIAKEGDLVSAHFGRCLEYEIIDVEGQSIKQRKTISNPGHAPGFLPEYLSKMEVNVIICGGMGPRAQELFREKNIQVVFAEGEINKVIDDFIKGVLKESIDKCEH